MFGVAVDAAVRAAFQNPTFQLVAQRPDPRVLVVHAFGGQLTGLAQRHDARHVFGARAASTLLVSPEQPGAEPGALLDVEDPDSLGGMQLVPGQTQQIDAALREVQRDLPHDLNGVGMENDPTVGHPLGDLFHGEDHAGFVVGRHDRHQSHVVVEMVLELGQVEPAPLVHAQFDHGIPVVFQLAADGQDPWMLYAGRDDRVFVGRRRQRPMNSGVVALGPATGEDDLAGIAAQQIGHALPGLANPYADLSAEGVHARGVAVKIAEVRLHRLEDFVGHLRRRVVIEVNRPHRLFPVLMFFLDRIAVLFDVQAVRDELPELGLDHVLHGKLGQLALGAHAAKRHDDLVAFHVDQLDVAAVGPQGRANLLVDSWIFWMLVSLLPFAGAGAGGSLTLSPWTRTMIFSISP